MYFVSPNVLSTMVGPECGFSIGFVVNVVTCCKTISILLVCYVDHATYTMIAHVWLMTVCPFFRQTADELHDEVFTAAESVNGQFCICAKGSI